MWSDNKVDNLEQTLHKAEQPAGTPVYVHVNAIKNLKTVRYAYHHCARTEHEPVPTIFMCAFLVH